MGSTRTLVIGLLLATGCVHVAPAPTEPEEEGLASWYGAELAGQVTANGEKFDPAAMTAAHRTLPFGRCVRVEVIDTGRSVEVRINDRGPFVAGRIIDLSEAAAKALGVSSRPPAPVRLGGCASGQKAP